MKKTKIPPEYVDAYKRHEMTIYVISKLIGKSPSTVFNALKDENVDTGSHRKRKTQRNQELVGVYQNSRNTLKDIGAQFGGISKQRVQQIIANAS